jgi:hypothetical protein
MEGSFGRCQALHPELGVQCHLARQHRMLDPDSMHLHEVNNHDYIGWPMPEGTFDHPEWYF